MTHCGRHWTSRPQPSTCSSACFARRYEKDGLLAPNTAKAARAGIDVFFGIPEEIRPPLHLISHLFRRGDPVGRWLLSQSAASEAAQVFAEATRLSTRSLQQWEYLMGAGGRLLEPLTSPVVWPRCGASLDWKEVIRNRRHFYLGMEGLPQSLATTLAILTYAPALQAARELSEETGQAHPFVVVLEEAGALSLVTPLITLAMQAYRKHGVSVWLASQTLDDFHDEATIEQLLAMSEHHWHQMAAGVERAARDCAFPTYDPNRVLHARERTEIQRYREVPTRSVRTDSDGWWRSITWGTAFRPVLKTRVDESFDNPSNHEAEYRQKLSTLRVGECYVRGLDGTIRTERTPLPEDPWGPFADEEITVDGRPRTLGQYRLSTAYDRIRSSILYQPPPVWTHPPHSPTASTPTPTCAPVTASVPSAMAGS